MRAPPITYEIDGVQYVSLLTGSGGGGLFSGETAPTPVSLTYGNLGQMLVFKLGGVMRPCPRQPLLIAASRSRRRRSGRSGYYSR